MLNEVKSYWWDLKTSPLGFWMLCEVGSPYHSNVGRNARTLSEIKVPSITSLSLLRPWTWASAHLGDMGLCPLALAVTLCLVGQQPLHLVLQHVTVNETLQLFDLLGPAASRLRGG